MNYYRKPITAFLLVLSLVVGLITTSQAATDASAHLDSYRAGCSAGSGSMIYVTADISGTGVMDSIGVSEIYIYKSTDNKHFSFLRCFTYEDFPAMMDYNTDIYYKTPIAFQGIAGSYYYANVYVYAEKDGSSSTRVYKTTSVQASN